MRVRNVRNAVYFLARIQPRNSPKLRNFRFGCYKSAAKVMGPLLFLLEFSASALTAGDHERPIYPLTRGKAVPNLVLRSISDTSSEPFVNPLYPS